MSHNYVWIMCVVGCRTVACNMRINAPRATDISMHHESSRPTTHIVMWYVCVCVRVRVCTPPRERTGPNNSPLSSHTHESYSPQCRLHSALAALSHYGIIVSCICCDQGHVCRSMHGSAHAAHTIGFLLHPAALSHCDVVVSFVCSVCSATAGCVTSHVWIMRHVCVACRGTLGSPTCMAMSYVHQGTTSSMAARVAVAAHALWHVCAPREAACSTRTSVHLHTPVHTYTYIYIQKNIYTYTHTHRIYIYVFGSMMHTGLPVPLLSRVMLCAHTWVLARGHRSCLSQ